MSATSLPLLGRAAEVAIIDKSVQAAQDGSSATLVLRGEAGIGKSTLLEYAVAAAQKAQLRVIRVTGFEQEADLAYGGLQALLRPLLDGLPDLPAPQQKALGAAIGLDDGPPPDRFLVGLATLTLLADTAAGTGLMCAVDDAQWLDQETQDVIGFVGRRLLSDGITLVVAVRDDERPVRLGGLQELRLTGLDEEPAAELLRRTADRIDEGIARSLVASTGANPLALIELAGELSDDQRTGRAPLPDPLPLGVRLGRVYQRRIDDLPPAARLALLLAAAESSGDGALMRRAAEILHVTPDDIAPAESAGLVELAPGPLFRHPLIRSAIYQSASPTDRRAVHRALAETDDLAERRAWNLAAAAAGPDEEVAAVLESAAMAARARGGYAASLRLATRSAELTVNPAHLGRRLLRIAEGVFLGGGGTASGELLQQAAARITDPVDRASVLRIQAGQLMLAGRAHEAYATQLAASRLVRDISPRLTRDTLFDALDLAASLSPDDVGEAVREARSLPPVETMTAVDHLLDAYATRVLDGLPAAAPAFLRACDAVLHQTGPVNMSGFYLATVTASELGGLDLAVELAREWVNQCRRRDNLTLLPLALAVHAAMTVGTGRFDEARALTAEAVETSNAGSGLLGTSGQAEEWLLAWTGPEQKARDTASRHLAESLPRSYPATVAHGALVHLELGLGNYAAALARALALAELDVLGPTTTWNLPDLAEAACRSGDVATARRAYEQFTAVAASSPAMRGVVERIAALLADDPHEADARYRQALAHLAESPAVLEVARTHLLYGEWLRRRRRRREATAALRAAHDIFDGIGAHIWARRAADELAATGESIDSRRSRPIDDLTARELQVSRLAAAGASNREIAGQLYLSTSTVEYHLRKAFRKLGIASRGRLQAALND
ncbi:helix-turn-helix transcriptional regulator, partial [Actinoplanes sp. RD1]|uniref:helix-turn-helix transcriptional regulator n=1 Tax=Actinoplanes sp. RD1 TaxID=3064538 RepID=UPI0027410342